MAIFQAIFAIALGAIVAIFAASNIEPVGVSFAGAVFRVPLIVLIAGLIALGFTLGKIVRIRPRRRPADTPPAK